MKVTTPSIGLKVPGPRPYLMAEVYAVAYEDEAPGDMDPILIRRARRASQLADLEAMLTQLPALFEKAMAEGSKVVRPTPPSAAPPPTAPAATFYDQGTPAAKVSPKPDLHGQPLVLTDETRKELRHAASRIAELTGEPANVQVPKDEAAGRALLAHMQAEILQLTEKAPPTSAAPGVKGHAGDETKNARVEPAAITHPPATWAKGDEYLLALPGVNVPAAKRACTNQHRHGNEPLRLTTEAWDSSIKHFGRPLCMGCQTLGGQA